MGPLVPFARLPMAHMRKMAGLAGCPYPDVVLLLVGQRELAHAVPPIAERGFRLPGPSNVQHAFRRPRQRSTAPSCRARRSADAPTSGLGGVPQRAATQRWTMRRCVAVEARQWLLGNRTEH